jgi:hypothetical protein
VSSAAEIERVLAGNLRAVEERMAKACRRAGRDQGSVALVAVTKAARPEWIPALVQLGVTQLGENRPQQLAQRAAALRLDAQWHLVGHLQRNKVRLVLPHAAMIHSVDSRRLLEAIDRVAAELKLRPRVLLEVNLSREPQKHGFAPEQLLAEIGALASFRNVSIEGLMTMPAWSEDPQQARPVFRELRALRDLLRERLRDQRPAQRGPHEPPSPPLNELSMGMTADFDVAIEEGATLVRIGTALWQGLKQG